MIVGARVGIAALVMAVPGKLLTPYLESIGWLDHGAPFRKIGFIIALGMILGATVVVGALVSLIGISRANGMIRGAMERYQAAYAQAAQQYKNLPQHVVSVGQSAVSQNAAHELASWLRLPSTIDTPTTTAPSNATSPANAVTTVETPMKIAYPLRALWQQPMAQITRFSRAQKRKRDC